MKKKTDNLVFIGNYGNRNVGDDAILHVLSQRYEKRFPNHEQFVFARFYPEDIPNIANATPLTMNIASIVFVLLHCQVVVIGGGGIFSAYTGPVAKLIPIFAVLSKILMKKVIYESLGFYSTAGWIEKNAVLFSMLLADDVSVRDQASIETVKPIARFKQIRQVNDPGLDIQPISPQQAREILKAESIQLDNRKNVLGVSIKRLKDPQLNQRYSEALVAFLKNVIKQNEYQLLFIPFCHDKDKYTEKDLEFSRELIQQLNTAEKIAMVSKYYAPTEVAGLVTLCDVFIGTRFHSIVFAHALKVPLIPISYEEKCSDFIVNNGYQLLEASTLKSNQLEKYLDMYQERTHDKR